MRTMSNPLPRPREVFYNPVQLRINIINARITVLVGGRALGKTTGIHGPRTLNCVIKMPGTSNAFISRTYKQFKTRIMGSLVSGWKDLGFEEYNEKTGKGHFVIGKRNRKWPAPKYPLGDYTQAIHFCNGSVIPLISQDRPGDANGSNIQSLHGDEVFQLNKEDLDENVIPALRGAPEFSKLSEYKSLTFTTSMPLTQDGYWVFDFEKQTDPELNKYILQVYARRDKTYRDLLDKWDAYSPSTRTQMQKEINQLDNLLNELRTDYCYYLEADSFENFHVLGERYFREQRRILPDDKFNTQILNLRPEGLAPGKRFYAQLHARHFYIDYDNTYFDNFIFLPDDKDTCLGDNDCDRNAPLELSFDFGGRINSLAIFQDKTSYSDAEYMLKEFFAEQPKYINHLVDEFCAYYAPMTCRNLNLYYDVSGHKHNSQSNETDIELVSRLLVENGWIVNRIEIDSNPLHNDKFEFMNLLLSEQDRRLPRLRVHEQNCPNAKIAMFNAPLKIGEKGTKVKDKTSERMSSKTPQRQATHITDAIDYYLFRKYRGNIGESVSIGITLFGG